LALTLGFDTMARAQRRRLFCTPQRVERVGRYLGSELGRAVIFPESLFVASERCLGVRERLDRIAFGAREFLDSTRSPRGGNLQSYT
jgi:hypothetical protein